MARPLALDAPQQVQHQAVEDLGLLARHPVAVRAAHWASVLAMAVLLFSGLQILNAHPAFYWGEVSRFASPVAGWPCPSPPSSLNAADALSAVATCFCWAT